MPHVLRHFTYSNVIAFVEFLAHFIHTQLPLFGGFGGGAWFKNHCFGQ
jgi:hypothetical protein